MTGLHSLVRVGERPHMRVGRGGKRGKTSGRGTKGQSARAGNKKRPEMRDVIKKLPKLRGHGKHRARTVFTLRPSPVAVPLEYIADAFEAGAVVSPESLIKAELVRARGGKTPAVKVLGNEINKKLAFEGCVFSQQARAAIEKAGGTIK